MTVASLLEAEIEQHQQTLSVLYQAVNTSFERLTHACEHSLKNGGKILFCGNGGSAADSQHLATELVVRYRRNRRAMAALALTTDTSALTASANDFSFDGVFARQVEALGRPGDVLIGISTSGDSANVLAALHMAKEIGVIPAGLSGGSGGAMKGLADPLIIVPSQVTARIQEMHILLGHALCEYLEINVP